MAGYTGCRKPFKLPVRMALFAEHSNMCTHQREITLIMVKGNIFPIQWGMTGNTICPETATVLIVLTMAGVTVCRGIPVNILLMTRVTCDFSVLPFQLEA